MATFIHIADEKKARLIKKSGIKAGKRGVFCFPVTMDFSLTHQWARELKRTGVRTLVCVQFKIEDTEMVSIGRYNGEKIFMTAAEALTAVADHVDPMGLEVILKRRVEAKEIVRIYPAPKVVGWRYYPGAKGRQPCHCRFCNRGEIKASRLIRDDA